MAAKHLGFFLGAMLAAVAMPVLAAPVSNAQVNGPIAAPDVPGAPSHNYIFFSSNHDLAANGYVEEEYFIKGTASRYNTPDLKTGSVQDSGHPYETRIVVRRPADPARFNGTVIVEWDNVSNMFDAENVWFFSWEHMMSAGYVWIGVSPQHVGVDALKTWSANRYGAFNVVDKDAAAGDDADAMSFDIYSQVGAALRHPGAVDVLHGLKPKLLIAAGESQSAGRLATYVNSIHPLAQVYDGFLLLSAVGKKIRSDLISPVLKISTEHDVAVGDAAARQPDTDKFRSWEVAGTSHVDQHLRASREPLELRDNGHSLEAAMAPLCAVPSVGTRVPTTYVVASALDKLARWSASGPPPSAPRLQIDQMMASPGRSVIGRDKDGLAQGGIQLSQLAVPVGVNYGVGGPADAAAARSGGEAIGAGACVRWGYYTPFDVATLDARYPSHAAYVAQVKKITADNLKHGYIVAADAAATVREAEQSHVGR